MYSVAENTSLWSCVLQKYQAETQTITSCIIIKTWRYWLCLLKIQSTVYSLCGNAHNTPGHDNPFINACNKKNTAEQLHAVAMDFHNQSSISSQCVLTRCWDLRGGRCLQQTSGNISSGVFRWCQQQEGRLWARFPFLIRRGLKSWNKSVKTPHFHPQICNWTPLST